MTRAFFICTTLRDYWWVRAAGARELVSALYVQGRRQCDTVELVSALNITNRLIKCIAGDCSKWALAPPPCLLWPAPELRW